MSSSSLLLYTYFRFLRLVLYRFIYIFYLLVNETTRKYHSNNAYFNLNLRQLTTFILVTICFFFGVLIPQILFQATSNWISFSLIQQSLLIITLFHLPSLWLLVSFGLFLPLYLGFYLSHFCCFCPPFLLFLVCFL